MVDLLIRQGTSGGLLPGINDFPEHFGQRHIPRIALDDWLKDERGVPRSLRHEVHDIKFGVDLDE